MNNFGKLIEWSLSAPLWEHQGTPKSSLYNYVHCRLMLNSGVVYTLETQVRVTTQLRFHFLCLT